MVGRTVSYRLHQRLPGTAAVKAGAYVKLIREATSGHSAANRSRQRLAAPFVRRLAVAQIYGPTKLRGVVENCREECELGRLQGVPQLPVCLRCLWTTS